MKAALVAASVWALASFHGLAPAGAETTQCIEITSVPFTIVAPGVYCLKKVISTAMTSGNAITINASNVVIDFNDFRLGGLSAGPATTANGVYALNRQNITLRNGNIRGFKTGIWLDETDSGTLSSGHLLEDSLIEGSTTNGIRVSGASVVVRGNRVVNTDSTPPSSPTAQAAPSASAQVTADGAARQGKAPTALSNQPTPQAGTGVSTRGIIAMKVRGGQISDNFVSNTISSAGDAMGIGLFGSVSIDVSFNTVLNTRGYSYVSGIYVTNTIDSATTITGNRIISGPVTTGTTYGIERDIGIVVCADNTIAGFASGKTFGCTAP